MSAGNRMLLDEINEDGADCSGALTLAELEAALSTVNTLRTRSGKKRPEIWDYLFLASNAILCAVKAERRHSANESSSPTPALSPEPSTRAEKP